MLHVDIIQAEFGDCFLIELEDDSSNPHNLLIDGGPSAIYKEHLRPTLQEICKNKILDLIICTHIDVDHIGGLLALFVDMDSNKTGSSKLGLSVNGLWHNSLQGLLGASTVDTVRINEFLTSIESLNYNNFEKPDTLSVMKAVGEGIELGDLGKQLSIPLNYQFKNGLVVTDKNTTQIKIGNATLQILGPSQKNIERLRKLWSDWVAKHSKNKVGYEKYEELIAVDSSVSNLSSIMFLMEYEGKKAIFTGDGLGNDLIQMLSLKGLMDKDGKIHVDLLKVPHHGSERNISKEFFDRIIADTYIISANGRDANPSLSTLELIIEYAEKRGNKIKIVATNRTPNIDKVILKYPEQKFNYEFQFLKKDENYMKLALN
jgi:beta-lactamase superfamily II metal-dependent hydrolase